MITAINWVAIFSSAAIQRRRTGLALALKWPFNLREDGAFWDSNNVPDAAIKKNKAESKSHKVKLKDVITVSDKDRLAH